MLLTPSSVRSAWVQEEIDGAFIEKIDGRLTLVPLVAGVTREQIPLLLRTTLWVAMDRFDEAVRQLSNQCHGIDETPPVGNPPAWKVAAVDLGLTRGAAALAALLCRSSVNGNRFDPKVAGDEVMSALDLAREDFLDVVSELRDMGMVGCHESMRTADGIDQIWPLPSLFAECDHQIMGWDTEEDARALAVEIVNRGAMSAQELREILGWPPRRLNPAMVWLKENDLVRALDSSGGGPYAFVHVHPKDRLRRFAKRKL